MGRTILITGGAGYVGEMLVEQLAAREDVKQIIAIDKESQGESTKNLEKVIYLKSNVADDGWQEEAAQYEPDTVIHTAWQIRTMYGREDEQWRWNVDGSERVFDFAFQLSSVRKLIYFSTASAYSARKDNTLEHAFTEQEDFRDDEYLYAEEKKQVEENLLAKFTAAEMANTHTPQIFVVRPAAITGPRGRYLRDRFGLQTALQGNLKGGGVFRLVTALTAFMPATAHWVRQFIHEDDVVDIISMFVFENFSQKYQIFNITPTGEPVSAADMAAAVGKKVLPIYPWMVRLAFFIFWHGTRGKVPTAPGSWRFYSYPLVISGDKLATVYTCQYSSQEALSYTDGRYEKYLADDLKKARPVKIAEETPTEDKSHQVS